MEDCPFYEETISTTFYSFFAKNGEHHMVYLLHRPVQHCQHEVVPLQQPQS